ncbi:MAG: cobalt-precorrin-5B (C(1))-methyltransferase [Alphaproteobacteria bacterium]
MSVNENPLRKGWTTGACACAAASAAVRALLGDEFPDPVSITLPGGETPSFALSRMQIHNNEATAGVIKDAGDDPDVTHGAEIIAGVRRGAAGAGISFHAGDGVGTVTLPGLPVDVGEPAINPMPRRMMIDAVTAIAVEHGTAPDFDITVSIPGGAALAKKTMNGRLGIVDGLSILGTTGIVRPYSCSAWIHAIHSGIDVARAGGMTHIAASTGSTSEDTVRILHGMADTALIEMGDFAGGLLKYLRRNPVPRLTIAGGFGKLTKLAQGKVDLHSDRSAVNFKNLSERLAVLGADEDGIKRAANANTAMEVLEMAGHLNLPIADAIAVGAREVALATLAGDTEVEVIVVARDGTIVGRAG